VLSAIKKQIYFYSNNQDSRTILKNSFSLLLIQGTNFILPLLILPYLIKTIGLEKFGMVSFAQSFVSYFIIFIDYGYNFTATREISISRSDKIKVENIVCTVLLTKLILTLISFILLVFAISTITYLSKTPYLYYFSFFLVIGQAIIPTWFFQGVEKMKYLTYVNLISKILFTILIFVLITKPEHYLYITLLLSLGNIISGIIGLWIIRKKFEIHFHFPKSYNLKKELANGWYTFISNFSINAYINSNLLILAFYSSPIVVGYYSIIDKITYALRQLLTVFFQATYPQACKCALESHQKLKNFFKQYFLIFAFFIFILCAICFINADFITLKLTGNSSSEISALFRISSCIPIIICLNIPAFQTLLAYNFQKSYMVILFSGSLLNIFLNMILARYFSAVGTSVAVICTELFITVGLYLILNLRHSQFNLIKK
jgi:PST family polysaccharide transporter